MSSTLRTMRRAANRTRWYQERRPVYMPRQHSVIDLTNLPDIVARLTAPKAA